MESITSDLLIYEVAKYLPVEDRCLLMFLMKKSNHYGRIIFNEGCTFQMVPHRNRLTYYKRLGRMLYESQSSDDLLFVVDYLVENKNFTEEDRHYCLIANDVKDELRTISPSILLENIIYAIGGRATRATAEYMKYIGPNTRELLPVQISVGTVDNEVTINEVVKVTVEALYICIVYDQFSLFNRFYHQYMNNSGARLSGYDFLRLLLNCEKLVDWVNLLYDYKEVHSYLIYELIFYHGRRELLPFLVQLDAKGGCALIPSRLLKEPLISIDRLVKNSQDAALLDELLMILERESSKNGIAYSLVLLLTTTRPNSMKRIFNKPFGDIYIQWMLSWKRDDVLVHLLDSQNYERVISSLVDSGQFETLNKHRSLLRRCSIPRGCFKSCKDPSLIELIIGPSDHS